MPNGQQVYWVPRSECTHGAGCGVRRQRAMSRASTTSSVRRWSAIDQPTTRRENTSSTTAAVDPALAGAVLGDVGDPEPVRGVGDEPALHQVRAGRLGAAACAPPAAVHPGEAGGSASAVPPAAARPAVPGRAAVRRAPAGAVGAAGGGVDVDDRVQQVGVVEVTGRRRAGAASRSSPSVDTLSTRQVTATAKPSAASSWTSRNPILGARSPARSRPRRA